MSQTQTAEFRLSNIPVPAKVTRSPGATRKANVAKRRAGQAAALGALFSFYWQLPDGTQLVYSTTQDCWAGPNGLYKNGPDGFPLDVDGKLLPGEKTWTRVPSFTLKTKRS